MASTSNIAINSISAISDIAVNSVNMIEAYHWNGTNLNLVWQKGGATASWVTSTTDYVFLAEYTPSVAMQVSSFKMIQNKNAPVYNYFYGIYVKSTSAPVANAVATNNSGVSIVADGTYLGENKYIHTKTYSAGAYPALTAGVTYYFGCAERYTAYKILSGSNIAGNVRGWSVGNNPIQPIVAVATPIYLEVIAV